MNILYINGYSRGRIHMENNKDFIAFNLDESLYFEHGQEISEMVSISLDPDITLERQETYAQISGVIVLNGTYEKVSDQSASQPYVTQDQQDKYIEKIVDHHNGTTADFYHRFPIEISIPKERVNRLEDVRVKIAVFDYELPDHHTVKLSATVHITGLMEEVEVEKIEEEDIVVEEIEEKDFVIEDIKDTENIEDAKDTRKTDDVVKDEKKSVEQPENQIIETTDEHVEVANDDEEVIESDARVNIEDDAEADVETLEQEETEGEQEIDISLQKTEQEEEIEQVKDVQFLTELFASDEEEMQTTVTIYISQETDTIESIAKRFEIPTLRLIKDNDLAGDKISTGQLLYIPRT